MNQTFRKLVSGALIFLMVHGHAYAAGTVLATSPLVTSPSDSILPNLLFAFDDSGSMGWQHMPDDSSDGGSSVVWQYGWFGGRSSQCNGIYFNPSITYTRPVDSTGASYPHANFYAAWSNGFDTSSSTTNLSSSYRALNGDSGAITVDASNTAAYYYAYSGTQTGAQKDYNSTTSTFATECNSNRGSSSEPGTVPAIWTRVNVSKTTTVNSYTRSATSGACTITVTTPANGTVGMTVGKVLNVSGMNNTTLNGFQTVVTVPTSTTFTFAATNCGTAPAAGGSIEFSPNATDHRQNFANWFSYYRTRILMMKTSMGLAVKDIGNSYRVGFMSMNQDADFLNVSTFDTAHKASFYTLLYGKTVGSGTPLRTLLSKAGKYYANKLTLSGVTLTDPVQYSCQQNFTILSTDGFWNSGNGTDLAGATIGNTDGSEPRPMSDGSTTVTTAITPHTVTVRKSSLQNTTTNTPHTRTETAVSGSINCSTIPASTGRTGGGPCYQDNGENSFDGNVRTWCMGTAANPPNSNDCKQYGPGAYACRGIINSTNLPGFTPSNTGCVFDTNGQQWCLFTSNASGFSCSRVYSNNNIRGCMAQSAGGANNGYTVTTTPQTYTQTAVGSTTTLTDTATNTPSQVVTTNGVAAPATNLTPIVTITTVATGAPPAPATNPTFATTSDNGAPTGGSTFVNGTVTTSCQVTPPAAGTTAVTAGTPVLTNNGAAVVTTVSTSGDVVGTTVTSGGSPSGGTSNTLSDVAEYYYITDLRTSTLANCTGAVVPPASTGFDVCTNDVPVSGNDTASWQHMTTFTLAMGARGRMLYSPTYLTDTSGDFFAVKNGSTANGTTVCPWQTSGACNWPTPGMTGSDGLIANIDDTWHAAVNGRGQYFSATDPATLTLGLTTALAGVKTRTGSSAAATTSNPNVTSGDNFVFSSTFTTQDWDGELVRQQLDLVTGVVSSTIDWTAQSQLDSLPLSGSPSRKIYFRDTTNVSGTLTGLRLFTYANLGATAKTYFDAANITTISQFCTPAGTAPCLDTGLPATAAGANLVSYLTGDRTNEGTEAQTSKFYRVRKHLLGDIVNAEAVYVKSPLLAYSDAGFSTYSTSAPVSTRTGIVYVAANDGMMHAFNANTGAESFAYVPSFVLPSMYKLADKKYGTSVGQPHQYFVDGTPVSGDIYYGGAWRTIVVAGLNGGGKGYYALDVTDPTNPKSLWEFTDVNMGYAFGNPIITKLKDCDKTTPLTEAATCTNGSGTWVVLLTSGYNNDLTGQDGMGHLYVVNAGSGALIRDISTGVGSTTTPSGLAKINAWVDNTASDNTSLRAYGGDLLGNVWRFDINNSYGTAGYDAQKLVTLTSDVAGSVPQPITTKPEIGDVNGTPVVYVGTGRYLATSDLTDTQQQSFYALKDTLDTATLPNPRAAGSTFIKQDLTITTCPAGSPTTICSAGQIVRTSTSKTVTFPGNAGWYIDLPDSKERANTDPTLALGTLGFTTNVPNVSACTAGGTSFRYLLDYRSGAPLSTSTTGVSGIQLGSALATRAVFVRLPNNTVVQLTRMSDGTTLTTNVPISAGGAGTRRVSWRELIQDQ
jgi:type IV pilus assembly protein PilY1